METVLFVNNSPRRCGVYEFGKSTYGAASKSRKYAYCYREFSELTDANDFLRCVEGIQPDAIIYNWHPVTMPWLNDEVLYSIHQKFPNLRSASLVHDAAAPFDWLDGNIFCDPTHVASGRDYVVGRCIAERSFPSHDSGLSHSPGSSHDSNPVIGSFGFGLGGKGFQRVVAQVNAEFDKATIRLHVPQSDYCDATGSVSRSLMAECVAMAKPGVKVVCSTEYLSTDALLEWLNGNTINCFFYDEMRGPGISSVIDLALTARRPIAITASTMFRHVTNATPSIIIGQSSLKVIIKQGTSPLEPFYEAWTEENLARGIDSAMDGILSQPSLDLTGNRVLTPRDRQRLRPVVEDLTTLCPDIMSRKFPEAVFQNAFIFEQARQIAKPNDRIILIGGYEDPIGPALRRIGFDVTITDPQVDGRDSDDVLIDSIREGKVYDLVISCSVMEHVEQDFEFVKAIYELLAPGGTALLTTDFRDGWEPSINKPSSDVRLYTVQRLRLLAGSLPAEAIPDGHDWQPVAPYFHCDNSDYGFCSLMFRKPDADQSRAYSPRCLIRRLDRTNVVLEKLESELKQLANENQQLANDNQRLRGEIEQIKTPQAARSWKRVILKQTRKIRSRRLEDFARRARCLVGL